MKIGTFISTLVVTASILSVHFVANAGLKKMEIEFDPLSKKASANVKKVMPSQCSFNMLSLGDERQNKETVANAISDSIGISNIDSYLDSIRQAKNTYTLNTSAEHNIDVNARLIRMYSYPESMNILGVTAVVADFVVNGKIVKSKQYRGFYAKTNWANGDGEYLTAINDSAQELIVSYAADLSAICKELTE